MKNLLAVIDIQYGEMKNLAARLDQIIYTAMYNNMPLIISNNKWKVLNKYEVQVLASFKIWQ